MARGVWLALVAAALMMPVSGAVAAASGTQADAAPATPASPSAAALGQVQKFCDTLLDMMKNAKALGIKGRFDKLEPVVEATFDIAFMTKTIVGPGWDAITPADQKALIAAFQRMTIADYAKNFDGYSGEKFVVDPNVVDHGVDKLVSTQLVAADQSATPFIYRMRQSGDAWKIIDIYLNGYVSELATRRSDFKSTLDSGGAPALIKKINALADTLMASA